METEAEKPKMCSCKCGKGAAVIVLIFLVAGAVCWHVHAPNHIHLKTGNSYTFHFRQGALLGQGSSGMAENSANGRLIAVNREAVLIEFSKWHPTERVSKPRNMWIPKSNILFIEYHRREDK